MSHLNTTTMSTPTPMTIIPEKVEEDHKSRAMKNLANDTTLKQQQAIAKWVNEAYASLTQPTTGTHSQLIADVLNPFVTFFGEGPFTRDELITIRAKLIEPLYERVVDAPELNQHAFDVLTLLLKNVEDNINAIGKATDRFDK